MTGTVLGMVEFDYLNFLSLSSQAPETLELFQLDIVTVHHHEPVRMLSRGWTSMSDASISYFLAESCFFLVYFLLFFLCFVELFAATSRR